MDEDFDVQADGSRPLRVAVIGASNSVMVGSFARILEEFADISVANRSIGATPNVVLLDFLVQERDVDYDFIVIETAVNDFLQENIYPKERARETLEFFIRYVRSVSTTRVVILTIPTRNVLVTPEMHWQEQLYDDIAARYNIPILNGFKLIRQLIGPAMYRAAAMGERAKRLLTVFQMPDKLWLSIAWRSLRDPHFATNALAISAFHDHAHFSFKFHYLVGQMLRAFMRRHQTLDDIGMAENADQVRDVIMPSEPKGGTSLTRSSSLIQRDLKLLSVGTAVEYDVPKGSRAFGIMVNVAQTNAIIKFDSPIGATTFDLRFIPVTSKWNAAILQILDPLGEGTVRVEILDLPEPPIGAHRWPRTGSSVAKPQAELGELIILKQAWREMLPEHMAELAEPVRIEDDPISKRFIMEAAATADRMVRDVEQDGRYLDLLSFQFSEELLNRQSGRISVTDQARLMLALGMTNRLGPFLEQQSDDDACVELFQMRALMREIDADNALTAEDLLAKARKLIRENRPEEAEPLLIDGAARFRRTAMIFLIEYAWIALRRRDHPEAMKRWQVVREANPAMPNGSLGLAMSLISAGKRQEADDLLTPLTRTFPNSSAVAALHAYVAVELNNGVEALSRLQMVRDRFPSDRGNRMLLLSWLIRQGDFSSAQEEVRQVLRAGFGGNDLVSNVITIINALSDVMWTKDIWHQLVSKIADTERILSDSRSLFAHYKDMCECDFLISWAER